MKTAVVEPSVRIIRKPELLKMVGASDPTVWRWEKKNQFPKRIQLGANSVGWLESEVLQWFQDRSDARG